MLAAMLTVAIQVAMPSPAPPPPAIIDDSMPGPWFVPVEGAADRSFPEAPVILRDIAQAYRRTDTDAMMCVERPIRRAHDRRDRRLLRRMERALRGAGVERIRVAGLRCEGVVRRGSSGGVMVSLVPREHPTR